MGNFRGRIGAHRMAILTLLYRSCPEDTFNLSVEFANPILNPFVILEKEEE